MAKTPQRELHPEMRNWLIKNVPFVYPIDRPELWILGACRSFALANIHEVGGNNQGYFVKLIQETVGDACGEAWCVAAGQTVIAFVEEVCKQKSKWSATEHTQTLWNYINKNCPDLVLKTPEAGCGVFWRHKGTTNGHFGIFEHMIDKTHMKTFEGNTSPDTNKIDSDGQGYYSKIRPFGDFGDFELLGFAKIFDYNPKKVA